ncbi:uncharacterized protein LOC143196599 [Rhynchophorus ferrugineus]|uniref:uncharacterized protein LOC143196599 n=1 Tax=Rhynchophorus ferrugineus TaxID=354439 RepID=UPI003FCD5D4F
MDSFYDAPRRPPQPFIREALTATPVVPEVSVLCAPNVQKNAFTPYNHWKMQQLAAIQRPLVAENKENLNQLPSAPNASILKKQVRFEGPSAAFVPLKRITENKVNDVVQENKTIEKDKLSFEQMYMANIPSRKLDLSIIDLPNKKSPVLSKDDKVKPDISNKTCTANSEPKTYKEFLDSQRTDTQIILNDSVTDIFNYKRSSPLINIQACGSDNGPLPQRPCFTPKVERKYMSEPQMSRETSEKVFNQIRKTEDKFCSDNDHADIRSSYMKNDQHVQSPSNIQREDYTRVPYYGENIADFRNYGASASSMKKCDSCDCKLKAANTLQVAKCDDGVSVKDLLNIISQQNQQIAQQNEQLILLQKQVSTLICQQNERDARNVKSIGFNTNQNYDICNKATVKQGCLTSTQHEYYNGTRQLDILPAKTKNKVPNFSIGVMTSFEVSIRNASEKANFPPKIEEINEVVEKQVPLNDYKHGHQSFDNNKTLADVSMVFKEPITVRERSPSPEPSIKINMKDFEDSDCEEEESSEIGPTFYNNLMSQVNKILQKAQIQTREELSGNFNGENAERLKNETMHKVKEATIKHLRNIGVEVPSYNDSSTCSLDEIGGKSYDQEDISFTVKQLLMKYLPDDQLAKIGKIEPKCGNLATLTPKEKIGTIKNRPEFSFATVQYMKKYNLIANAQKDHLNSQSPDKVLDMTKLKQQPKLL